ncbi:DsbA family oxidoreductase [Streptomyces venezuelae]|uniref:DsbA family oxidoreductase n=1 Tax=Streptomyces venezuelae TaxID=54571 RepID=A0A5P2D0E6_STRVZ|nr:DsbA family oxidoreductase [Streptomyces venezuelae]QES47508.1 DsbA family oxidoreductase [Streptomyces venezuelae]
MSTGTTAPLRVDIWSDLSCPWCYITKRTFEAALVASGRADVQVVAHPYQIDGERPAEPTPMIEWLGGKYGAERARRMDEEVTAAGPRHGITFHNASGYAVNTLQAHRLLRHAGRHGRAVQSALEELVFAAYFTHRGNIADPALLAGLAERAGLDREEALAYLASDRDLAEIRAEIRTAREDGITAVPVFTFSNGHRIEGAQQEQDLFLSALAPATGETST